MPLWEIQYSDEVKFYFVDSGDYTGNLLGEIERLRYAPDGLPAEHYREIGPDLLVWEVLNHLVFYQRRGNTLLIAVVKPL